MSEAKKVPVADTQRLFSVEATPDFYSIINIERYKFLVKIIEAGKNFFQRNVEFEIEEEDELVLRLYNIALEKVGGLYPDITPRKFFFTHPSFLIIYDSELMVYHANGTISLFGADEDAVVKAYNVLNDYQKQSDPFKKTVISWAYNSGRGVQYKNFPIDNVKPICDELYPYIEGGVTNYMEDYLKSEAAVLIMMGEPGTGKSSFIKSLIKLYNRSCMLTYDEAIMRDDAFFVSFLNNENMKLLIIEDADLLLLSRVKDNNQTMAKILNVSEGVVKILDKKIILSTNLTSLEDVDEALVRPGRCYDSLHFRPLTFEEAVIAAEKTGAKVPTKKKEYTLAELFVGKNNYAKPKSVGFWDR